MNIHSRKCSFCRQPGHTVNNCFTAYQAAYILHQSIMNIIGVYSTTSRSDYFNSLKNYLNLHNMKELKLIARFHSDFEAFVIRFKQQLNPNINIYLKRGLINVLTLYYYTQVEVTVSNSEKKYNIKSSINNLITEQEFSCPICLDEVDNKFRITTNCNHYICSKCFETYLEKMREQEKEPCCSLCRADIKYVSFTNEETCNSLKDKYFC